MAKKQNTILFLGCHIINNIQDYNISRHILGATPTGPNLTLTVSAAIDAPPKPQ
jgi:hypothetical protein